MVGGGTCLGGVPALGVSVSPGGCLVQRAGGGCACSWGGVWSGGYSCSRGGACSRGRGVPGGDPPETATAAGGMHPTGMHSC